MPVRAPLGESNFLRLRAEDLTYVDKTHEVAALLRDPARVILLTRPRRFGKTLLLATLRAFVEPPRPGAETTGSAFAGTAIDTDTTVAAHRQRHPVISLTFRELRASTYAEMEEAFAAMIRRQLIEHGWVAEGSLSAIERDIWATLAGSAPAVGPLRRALFELTRWLHTATGEPVVVLIDEYDTPLQTGWLNGYYDAAVGLIRPFLSEALKDNPHLHKAVLTGITRIARDSLFSGLNNLVVDSVLDVRHPACCGFTEAEVEQLLAAADLLDQRDEVRAWYDGYEVAGVRLYNPWSVLSFVDRPQAGFQPHWVNTGGDELLRSLLISGDPDVQVPAEAILRGESIERPIVDHLVLRDLPADANAIWTLLVHAGYLQASCTRREDGETLAKLMPPNHELRLAWRILYKRWMFSAGQGADGLRRLTDALLGGDQETLEASLQTFALRNLTYLDPTGAAPERVWHAFVLGLLAHLQPTHRVQSEQPAGFGRADVLVVPHRPGPGAVLEFKRRRAHESASEALDAAMMQIDTRRYADRLAEAGASPRWKVAVVFSGQEVSVRVEAG